jgi:toxin-antitoxin system PIN domain toxin
LTKSFLVDVNVWIAISHELHVYHRQAARWFETLSSRQALFCRLTQLGYLRLLTNRNAMGDQVLSQSKAWETFDRLTNDPRVSFLAEPAGIDAHFRRLTQGPHAATKAWSDAYIAAVAHSSDLVVATTDRAFKSFPGVDAVILS